ncbi:MAG: hypothetical protein ACLT2Z_02915 [Eubacterium sp.]
MVIIFQPELRRALEQLGKKNVFFKILKFGNNIIEDGISDKSIEEIIRATLEMAKVKTGALIVVARDHDLSQYCETGITLVQKLQVSY